MLALVATLALAAAPTARQVARAAEPVGTVEPIFLHDLSTPEGPVRLSWPSLSRDAEHDETLLVAEGFVRIFDAAGLEVHRFGDDGAMGPVIRAVAVERGDFVVLSVLDGQRTYFRCDYRGELVLRFGLTGLPPELAGFWPDLMVYRAGELYLVERGTMRVVVASTSGEFIRSVDLRRLIARALPPDDDRRPATTLDGFAVDGGGNLLFTMSTMFAAARVTPRGEVQVFGSRGSRPGTFNVVGSVDADEQGHVFVTDRLRSVVSVWNRDLRFMAEFGYRGDGTSNLVAPYEIAAGRGRVTVAQAAARGAKVFSVHFEEPSIRTPDTSGLPPPPPPPPPLRAGGR